jgi:hypothetical protein
VTVRLEQSGAGILSEDEFAGLALTGDGAFVEFTDVSPGATPPPEAQLVFQAVRPEWFARLRAGVPFSDGGFPGYTGLAASDY